MRRTTSTSFLTWLLASLSAGLLLVLAASLVLRQPGQAPPIVEDTAMLLLHAAAAVWPATLLLAICWGVAVLLAILRPELRRWPWFILLGTCAVTLAALWTSGVRPPTSRVGVFVGMYVQHPLCCRTDIFIPAPTANRPLSRGADLWGLPDDLPPIATVRAPESGWGGNHPDSWPSLPSDSHGAQYFCVRMRGTLMGPGQYGRPPVLQYRFAVDTVLAVRPQLPSGFECDGPSPERLRRR